jgi:putative MATE family efflux protein
MVTIGLPAAVGGMMQALYDVTDRLFVSKLGTDEISGVSLVMPIMFCMFAISQSVNVGIATLVSRHLGEGRKERARDVLNHGLLLSVGVGGLLTLALLAWMEPMLTAMGAEGELRNSARAFAQIIFAGIIMMQIGTAADGALRAQGNTVTPMKVGVATNIVNVVLNPILIFGLHMGVRGSATATLLARTMMAVILVSRLWTGSSEVRPGGLFGMAMQDRLRVIGRIYWMGLPASVGMLSMSLSVVAINKLLIGLSPHAVGVLGIAGSVEMAATVPIFALFSAVLPMVGYNLGARHYQRIREIVVTAGWLGAAVMGSAGVVIFAFPAAFFGFFSRDPEMLPMGVQYFRIMMPAYPLIGATIMMSAGFQGLGKSWIAMIMHFLRNVVTKLPFAYWFAALWGVTGVWWCFPASTLATAGFSFVWMWLVLRKLGAEPSTCEDAPSVTDGGLAAAESEVL